MRRSIANITLRKFRAEVMFLERITPRRDVANDAGYVNNVSNTEHGDYLVAVGALMVERWP